MNRRGGLACPPVNALHLHDLYIYTSNLWKPKPYRASGYDCAKRYFRADIVGTDLHVRLPLQVVCVMYVGASDWILVMPTLF